MEAYHNYLTLSVFYISLLSVAFSISIRFKVLIVALVQLP